MSKSEKIRRLLARGLSVKEIVKQTKFSVNLVHQVKWQAAKNKQAQPERSHNPKVVKAEKKYIKKVKAAFKSPRSRLIQEVFQAKKALEVISPPDMVNHPPHYRDGGIETIDFIEAKDLNYRLGNVVKYVSRAGKKDSDPLVDLKKARWYLDREIFAREGA
jgi:hypothetical protein